VLLSRARFMRKPLTDDPTVLAYAPLRSQNLINAKCCPYSDAGHLRYDGECKFNVTSSETDNFCYTVHAMLSHI
jgi:hypothetical protein